MKILQSDNLFFTSDTHFGHKNIINLCNRPFENVEDMNNQLILNWNSVVPKDGIVYHLGDFAFGSSNLWNSMLDQLNGEIHLIIGNHDVKNLRKSYIERFASVNVQETLQIDDLCIYLNHYPFLCFGGAYTDNVWQLFGHVHSGPNNTGKDAERMQYLFKRQYDVGVDNNNYFPISFNELKIKLNESNN